MKLKGSALIWTFIWCIFMGVTAISIGLGALFPSLNLIAKPFVCPGGEMQVVSQYYQVSPVESVTTLTWYCVDAKTGAKTELGIFPMSLFAGVIYGLLLFVVVIIGMTIWDNYQRPRLGIGDTDDSVEQAEGFRRQAEKFQERAEQFPNSAGKARASGDVLSRMKELKELRAANMISEAEYEKKRAEILKDL